MRALGLTPLIAAAMMVSATVSFAQNNTPPANAVENPANTPQHSSGSGTAPENMGATGWTGVRRRICSMSERLRCACRHDLPRFRVRRSTRVDGQ